MISLCPYVHHDLTVIILFIKATQEKSDRYCKSQNDYTYDITEYLSKSYANTSLDSLKYIEQMLNFHENQHLKNQGIWTIKNIKKLSPKLKKGNFDN